MMVIVIVILYVVMRSYLRGKMAQKKEADE
jgi:hypothetical protein